jgi:hypothetical protein
MNLKILIRWQEYAGSPGSTLVDNPWDKGHIPWSKGFNERTSKPSSRFFDVLLRIL